MKINQIETADMEILAIILDNKNIKIIFKSVYDLLTNKYIYNIILCFYDWESIIYEKYDNISNIYQEIDIYRLDDCKKIFDIVQLIEAIDKQFILKGADLNMRCDSSESLMIINKLSKFL